MIRRKKQFCKYNHDTFLVGRTKSGNCNSCKELQKSHRIKVQFCPKGHDISIVGRDKNRVCNGCKKQWSLEHSDYFKNYINEHSQEIAESKRQWHLEHMDSYRASSIKCQTNRNLRVVAWTDWDKIKEIYANCPKGMEVDHIIPLQGKEVSGLHVSWNLQYLTPTANRSKRNKLIC